jgi:hypothetical protein
MASLQISKSEYMMFLKHPAWLWLKKHDKAKLPPPDDNLQAMFDAGNKFEAYAEQLFEGGVRIGFDNYDEYLSMPKRTTEALAKGATTIFQGRFEHEQLTFICDVMCVVGNPADKLVDLIEIKSSTTAKLEHQLDLAFQVVVLEGCGYTVRNISVVHVNNSYERQGEIDVRMLTATSDVTADVKLKLEQTRRDIKAAVQVAQEATMPNPSPSRCRLSSISEWLGIYKGLDGIAIEEGSIYELARIDPSLVGSLEDAGITKLSSIPLEIIKNDAQKRQLEAVRAGVPLVNKDKIKGFLDGLEYPLYFFDYETMASVVPYFDGMRPYAQYPFQYSLHVITHPSAEVRHMGYLHSNNSNPAEELSKTLREQIGDHGSVLTWYMAFEKSCNTTLGQMLPEFAEFYASLNKRVVDLMVPFSKGWYVDAGFGGSASIKRVLPVLVPELSYKVLGIQEGGAAQRLWMESVLDGARVDEKAKILSDLVEYCALDTLAMVEIYNFLADLVGSAGPKAQPQQLALDW